MVSNSRKSCISSLAVSALSQVHRLTLRGQDDDRMPCVLLECQSFEEEQHFRRQSTETLFGFRPEMEQSHKEGQSTSTSNQIHTPKRGTLPKGTSHPSWERTPQSRLLATPSPGSERIRRVGDVCSFSGTIRKKSQETLRVPLAHIFLSHHISLGLSWFDWPSPHN